MMNNNETAIYSAVMAFILILVLQFSGGGTAGKDTDLKNGALNNPEGSLFLSQTVSAVPNTQSNLLIEEKQEKNEPVEEVTEDYVGDIEKPEINMMPVRMVDVLDFDIQAKSALINFLDDDIPLFYHNTLEKHPLASITKLLTAVVAIENIFPEETVVITENAYNAEGTAGDLRVGEEYVLEDLLKIMMMSSSNIASVALKEHIGSGEEFLNLMNEKAQEIGMENATFEDSSGLSDFNAGTARDVLALIVYVRNKHPEILEWTAKSSEVFQTVNGGRENMVRNIIPLTWHSGYVGGKTGTTDLAGQNLVVIFKVGENKKKDVVFIMFRSPDRYEELFRLLDWVERAYRF